MNVIDRCRYCSDTTGDPTAGGPDDVAPGVCPTCLDAHMAPLMLVALVHAAVDVEPEILKARPRGELIQIGVTSVWADRFVEGDELAFARARERLR